MIETVSEFLEEFKKKGLNEIASKDGDITHTVTIGNMFEGLTSELLNRSIFKGLNIKIVNNSFIYNDSGVLSKEMDCMIVIGDGQKISFSNQFKYHIKDVVGVIQVKKRLFKDSLDDAHQNLKSVIDTAEPRDGEMYMRRIQMDSYKLLMGKVMPLTKDISKKSWREQMIFHFLLMQSFWPIRILIGYESYKTEFGLREGFVNHLDDLVKDGPRAGYNPISFPDLMICGENSIIKNIGMPFGYPIQNDQEFYWEILQTTNNRPMYLLLEMIWTRLSYRFGLGSEIFGDDFALDAFHPFLNCKERKMDEMNYGWEYNYHGLTRKELSKPLVPIDWKPIEINKVESTILFTLINTHKIKCDKDLIEYLEKEKVTLDDFAEGLSKKRIAYKEGNEIILLMDLPIISFATDGKTYIGENKSGEMSNWIKKQASI